MADFYPAVWPAFILAITPQGQQLAQQVPLHGVGAHALGLLTRHTSQDGLELGAQVVYTRDRGGRHRRSPPARWVVNTLILPDLTPPVTPRSNSAETHPNGFQVADYARPTIEYNTCLENRSFGVRIGEHAQPILARNDCRHNVSGIAYFGTSGGTAWANMCRDNRMHGIQVAEQAQPVLERNSCISNSSYGIAVAAGARATLKGNACTGNYDGDVRIEKKTPSW